MASATPTPLRYPRDLAIEKGTDYFNIQIKKYIRNTTSLIAGTSNVALGPSIILPMPSNIQDSNSVGWGEDKMNNLVAGAVGGSYDIMSNLNFQDFIKGDFSQVEKAFKNALSTSGLSSDTARQLILRQLSAEAVNILGGNVTLEQLQARSTGNIFNPNSELLFNGVTLRSFRFSFKMTPRDEKERDLIKSIIKTLKKSMAPSKTNGEGDNTGKNDLYLSTPNVFDLQYRQGGAENGGKHPFLHSFKECALKDMSVNYTGENVYATYYDGTPISVIMDLTFQELVPVYSDEYDATIGVGY